MNVLVSAQGNDLSAVVDPRFGRAAWFLLVDTETGAFTAHDNGANADSAHGAGNASAAQAAAKSTVPEGSALPAKCSASV